MEERSKVQRASPWSEEMVEREAASLYRAVRGGVVIGHLRMAPVEHLEAVIARVKALAREEGVRLVVKREMEAGKVRYRLRRRRGNE